MPFPLHTAVGSTTANVSSLRDYILASDRGMDEFKQVFGAQLVRGFEGITYQGRRALDYDDFFVHKPNVIRPYFGSTQEEFKEAVDSGLIDVAKVDAAMVDNKSMILAMRALPSIVSLYSEAMRTVDYLLPEGIDQDLLKEIANGVNELYLKESLRRQVGQKDLLFISDSAVKILVQRYRSAARTKLEEYREEHPLPAEVAAIFEKYGHISNAICPKHYIFKK